MDLFDTADPGLRPLADRLRPQRVEEVAGQAHLLGPGKPLRRALEENRPHSMVLWGPPGSGKTTLARLFAHYWRARFLGLSAVLAGVKEIRAAVDQARAERARGVRTVLFVDEAHRFNKAQQDAFLPHIEDGTLIFIGATTENPSFELNNALLSRVRTYVLKPLADDDLRAVLKRALHDSEAGLGSRALSLTAAAEDVLIRAADGDARRALNLLELAADLTEDRTELSPDTVAEVATQGPRRFDKGGDVFYDQISALHKSVRGSDPDAALYWLARMLDGGCDPLYLARRIARMASEDIGNADPQGLVLALAAWDIFERLGSPEGELSIAQAVVYLACAPKSNAIYTAFNAAREDAATQGSLEVPMHLRNAPTRLMKEFGHGKDYRYAHDEPGAYAAGETYLPAELQGRRYYFPGERGLEAQIAGRLRELRGKDRKPESQ
jgi:putative ATPase